jgi:enoyl-CoA hydratase
MASELGYQVEDRVALVTLNAPERRNAFTLGLISEMKAAFDDIEARPDVGAVVVTGAPPAFCAGALLGDLAAPDASAAERRGRLGGIYEGFLRVVQCPLPTVAAVNGPAVGAGMNLALAADIRIAGESARFDSRFLKIGLHPGGGFTWMARRAMGGQATAAAALFSEVLSAAAAERCGLVWEVTKDDDLIEVACRYAARAASADPALVRRIKASMLLTGHAPTLEEAVAIEAEAQVWSMDQPAFRDGPVPNAASDRRGARSLSR